MMLLTIIRKLKASSNILIFNTNFHRLAQIIRWKSDNLATIIYYRGFMPPKISYELISLKVKSLGVAMSIAQDIFKAPI